MANCSHITNRNATPYVRTLPADFRRRFSHNANMARRGIPKNGVSWYLREWMAAKGITKQVDMMKLTDWSKATMSQLYNGTQDYSPKIIKEAAAALQIEEYELLMHPSQANAIRQLRRDALRVVETAKPLADDVKRSGTEG